MPLAVYVWLRHHGSFETGLTEVIRRGGDTDTVGAIAGALLAIHGGIPRHWLDGIADWAMSLRFLNETAEYAAHNQATLNWWPCLFLRNIGFLLIVLGRGFRRLLSF